ncbi:tetratricopeptide repeat protein [Myxococcus eversor]|uniref:tetratricopeptide repeat protein n=1 Tax=Myxococcus eversor TaxID=2709661 RepID=UPI0013D47249|nr:tetratricopeptide repeat protein [Myxococcus eversor]
MNPLPLPKERHLRPFPFFSAQKGGLWLLLVVIFVVSYNAASRSSSLREYLTPPVVTAFMVAVFLMLFGFFFWRIRRWSGAYNQGVSYFSAGDEQEAAHRFEEAARRSTQGAQRALSVAMVGQCLLSLGQASRALELFGSVERSGKLRGAVPAMHQWVPNLIAMAYLLQGELAPAREWLEEGRRRARGLPPTYAVLPDIILLCREGQYSAAQAALVSRIAEADALVGRDARRLKLVRAFTLDAVDPTMHAADIEASLTAARRSRPDDFEALSARWPELRAFMERRGLKTPVAA